MRFVFALIISLLAPAAYAQSSPAWTTGQSANASFASAPSPKGANSLGASLRFEAGQSTAQLFITGLWSARPLTLRLSVTYASGKTTPLDTYRHGKIVMLQGQPAYSLTLPRTALRPLKGGDTLVIEDTTMRGVIPLTGSSAAIKAAETRAGL
ncbi:hypothetical protein [Lentibacter sp.]|uniref:hypothetical protein n=1 Tax=Lentibacter sp. TaxID=2024994 RepID=UPI003F6957E0